jgi:hypothetical protein
MSPIRDSRSRLEGGGAVAAPLPIGDNRVGARQVVVAQSRCDKVTHQGIRSIPQGTIGSMALQDVHPISRSANGPPGDTDLPSAANAAIREVYREFVVLCQRLELLSEASVAIDGLLGAGLQTTVWLYILWHGGFPLFVIVCALLKEADPSKRQPSRALN